MYGRTRSMKRILALLILLGVACGTDSEVSATSEGESTSPATTTTPTSIAADTSSSGVELEIAVSEWTESRPPGDVAIEVRPSQVWNPELEFGVDARTFGTFDVGESWEFAGYPDGFTGSEIVVKFEMTRDMVDISGSVQAMTHIEIYDSEVLVWGMAIPGFEQTFDR